MDQPDYDLIAATHALIESGGRVEIGARVIDSPTHTLLIMFSDGSTLRLGGSVHPKCTCHAMPKRLTQEPQMQEAARRACCVHGD